MRVKAFLTAGLCLTAAALGVVPATAKPLGKPADQADLGKIDHLVVIYEENHSFDNLWGLWPGVNGVKNADPAHTTQVGQTDARAALPCLLQVDVNLASPPLSGDCTGGTKADGTPYSSHFTNQPFAIDSYIPATGDQSKTCYVPRPAAPSGPANGVPAPTGAPGGCTRDLVHRYYQEQFQIDGGRQDRYVTGSDAAGLSMGYYDTTTLPFYNYMTGKDAPNYAIEDDFFQGAFGGSFLNHQFLIAAQAPLWPGGADGSGKTTGCSTGQANCDLHSVVDANGEPNSYPLYKPTTTAGAVTGPPTVADNPLTQKGTDPAGTKCAPPPAGAATPPPGTTCGDYAVNTIQPMSQPYSPGTAVGKRLPPLTTPTIGDELSSKAVSWAWYAGGWDNAAGITNGPGWTNGSGPSCSQPTFTNAMYPNCPDLLFQFHHQPFNYYAKYQSKLDAQGRETNQERIAHLKDEADFLASAKAGTLPAVSFVKPLGPENEHPGYTGVSQGDAHLVDVVKAIQASPDWKSTAIVITYDEFGGAWDHVPPPQDSASGTSDKWGPGTRIPAMVISPQLHKKAVVDSTPHDTTSILSTIEHRWGVAPLGTRDAAVADLGTAFEKGNDLPRISTKGAPETSHKHQGFWHWPW